MATDKTLELRKGGSDDTSIVLQSGTGVSFQIATASSNMKVMDTSGTLVFPFLRPAAAKTADYTVLQSECGYTFTNTGASGAVNFTLPTSPTTGTWYRFYVVADQTVTLTAGTTDTIVGIGNAAADTIAISTASKKVGGAIEVLWDGTNWLAFVSTMNDGTNTTQVTLAG